MITLLWPVKDFRITDDWSEHVSRTGYFGQPGIDLATYAQPIRPSQYKGKVLQAGWNPSGYGNTTFVEFQDAAGNGVVRIRNAHQETVGVKIGDIVNPTHSLGILGTTGNSSGLHTHMEVWLKIAGKWQNIDPLDPRYGIQFVSDISQLVPLDGSNVDVKPEYTPPVFGDMPLVTPSSAVWTALLLRETPSTKARILGRITPGERYRAFTYRMDHIGTFWLGVVHPLNYRTGWAAGYHNGVQLLVEVNETN